MGAGQRFSPPGRFNAAAAYQSKSADESIHHLQGERQLARDADLSGHAKIESTVRYSGADIEDALHWPNEWRYDVAVRIGLYRSATEATAVPPSARVRPACAKAEADVPITNHIRHAQALASIYTNQSGAPVNNLFDNRQRENGE